MTEFNRKESTVMYVCTYCHYADNVCECEDQIEPNKHYFLKITTTTELVYRAMPLNEIVYKEIEKE